VTVDDDPVDDPENVSVAGARTGAGSTATVLFSNPEDAATTTRVIAG